MPSLNALGEFKFSFSNIANEKADVEGKKLPYADLPLPAVEAAPMDFPVRNPDNMDVPPETGDFDFGAFLGSLPPDITPSVPDIPTEISSADEEPTADDDFNMNDLLGGLNMDAVDEPSPDEPSTEDLLGLGDLDLGGMDIGGDEGQPLDEPPPEEQIDDEDILPAADIPADESFNDDFSSDSGGEIIDDPFEASEGIDLGGESLDAESLGDGEELPASEDAGDFSFSDFTPNDILPDTDSDDERIDLGGEIDTDFNMPEEMPAGMPEETSAGMPEETPIDFGDFGSDFASESIELGSEPGSGDDEMDFSGGNDFGSSDFALDGIDDLFEKTKTEPIAPKPKKSFWKRKKVPVEDDMPEPDADVEEMQLSESDVERLLRTIASYPLNLRIACEELIAEQVLPPQQFSKLIRYLVNGANVKEAAALVEEITGKPIIIPKSYEKMTGAAFEAEQASFAYIFVHNFLPVFRLFAIIAAFIASVAYLGYRFVYIPVKAENMYKRGYERIAEGEYQRANQLFNEAFSTHRKKKWFYLYAEAFRDQRRYMLAEEKYDQLLHYYPRDKKGVLDYANLNTYYLLNYEKANRLLQQQLLDYSPDDYEGLLAAGDNFLLWADSDPDRFYDKYEDARFSYARLLNLRGWKVPILERMLIYFIRTDNLKEVLYLRHWFESDKKRKLSPAYLAELAGYLLDKQLEEVKGVPDPYLEGIQSVRNMLLQAIAEDPYLPESHYHLARYYNSLNNMHEERLTLENAIRAFNLAQTEDVRRRLYRVDTHFRYSNLLVSAREFFPAEDEIDKSIKLYEDFLERNLIKATPQLGQLYAAYGDIEYFVKSGNMEAALEHYHKAESYGYAPPEVKYRMGSAYYQTEDWGKSLEYLFSSSADLPLNRRLLYSLGNAAYRRNDYFAAEGYFNRLLYILESQKILLAETQPNNDPQFLELGERLMLAYNNMGVVCEALANQTGNREFRSRALSFYSESARAWDSITRNPETMTREVLVDTPGTQSVNQGYLNAQHALTPSSTYIPQIFPRIDKDVLEPSRWEELSKAGGLR